MEVVKASVDRFEGNYAVIYSDSDTRKFDVASEMLPPDIKPGTRLILQLHGDIIQKIEVDDRATKDAKDRIRRKYDILRQRKHHKKSD